MNNSFELKIDSSTYNNLFSKSLSDSFCNKFKSMIEKSIEYCFNISGNFSIFDKEQSGLNPLIFFISIKRPLS